MGWNNVFRMTSFVGIPWDGTEEVSYGQAWEFQTKVWEHMH